jgi:hypothetical protein
MGEALAVGLGVELGGTQAVHRQVRVNVGGVHRVLLPEVFCRR